MRGPKNKTNTLFLGVFHISVGPLDYWREITGITLLKVSTDSHLAMWYLEKTIQYLFFYSTNETEWETQVSWLFAASGAVENLKKLKLLAWHN